MIGKSVYLVVFIAIISYGYYFLKLDRGDLESQSIAYNLEVESLNIRFYGSNEIGLPVSVLPLAKGHTTGREKPRKIAFRLDNFSDEPVTVDATISHMTEKRFSGVSFSGSPTIAVEIPPRSQEVVEWEYVLKNIEGSVVDTIGIGVRASTPIAPSGNG